MFEELKELSTNSLEDTPPVLHGLREMAVTAMPTVLRTGSMPADILQGNREHAKKQLEEVYKQCKPLGMLQRQADKLLGDGSEFCIPAFLNILSEHLGRPPVVALAKHWLPSKEQMITQLEHLHASKPQTHMQMIRILVRASIFLQPPHEKNCTCPLCAHIASVMPASAQDTSTASSKRAAKASVPSQ